MASPGYFENSRPEMTRFLPASYRRVLEVGCGMATFRGNLSAPHEYWGIEPSPEAAAIARGRADRVLVGTFDAVAAELPAGAFDLVVCNDVIEHMADPDGFLERVRAHLAPGGVLVGSIPNVRFAVHLYELLVKKDWEYRDEGVLDRTHLRFFTARSLRRLFAAHRYRVDALAGINPLDVRGLAPRALAKRLLVAALGPDSAFLQFGFRIRPDDGGAGAHPKTETPPS
jgi:SAM-dependent methyltransferase